MMLRREHGDIIRFYGSTVSVNDWRQFGKKFEDIEEFDLANKNLTEIPFQLSYFHNLKTLILNGNQISRIQNLGNLNKLQAINLFNNQISIIEGFESQQVLQTLVLNKNPLVITQQGVQLLRNMKARGTKIEGLPQNWNI